MIKEHRHILQQAADGHLPRLVDGNSGINLDLFEELYKAGLVEAIDACADDGRCYMEPKITLAGREALSGFVDKSEPWWRSFDRRIAVIGIVLALVSILVAFVLA